MGSLTSGEPFFLLSQNEQYLNWLQNDEIAIEIGDTFNVKALLVSPFFYDFVDLKDNVDYNKYCI